MTQERPGSTLHANHLVEQYFRVRSAKQTRIGAATSAGESAAVAT